MIKWIMVSLGLGILSGRYVLGSESIALASRVGDYALWILMFTVGISVGNHKGILQKVRENTTKMLLIPFGVIIGSILGGILGSLITSLTFGEGVMVSMGLGWYSLSGVLVADLAGADVGTIAFLANLLRELLTFLLIPIVVTYVNPYTAVAIAGATSEDTTLPIIVKYTSQEMAIISVINGFICSAVVPIAIPMCHNIF